MSWQGRSGLALVYGAVLLAPLAWVLVTAMEPGAGEAFSRATGRADLAGELATSIFLALLTTLFAVLLGLPLALLLNLRRFPGRGLVRSLYLLPLLIPPHIHTIAWTRVIGDKGWLKLWLAERFAWSPDVRAAIGEPGTDAFLGHLYPGPAWIMACAYFPLVVLAVGAGLRSLDSEGVDAARLLGGRRAALRRVILPQVAPRLLAGAAFVFILSLTTYPVVSLLDTPTLVHRVFSVMSQAQGSLATATMVGLPLVIVAGAVIFGLGRIESRTGLAQRAGVAPAKRRAGVGTLVAVVLLLALSAGVPLGSLVYVAGPLNLSGAGDPDFYQQVFPRVGEAFAESLLITGIAVLALLILSWPLGRALARARGALAESVSLGALAFPPEILGVALLLIWSEAAAGVVPVWFTLLVALGVALPALLRRPVRESLVAYGALAGSLFALGMFVVESGLAETVQKRGFALIVLAYLARFLPFTVRMLRTGFQALDKDEEDAARLCGHGAVSRAINVVGPRMAGAVAGAAVMGYVLCFTELPATLHTIRPGWQSIQMRIFNMVHYQQIEEVCALCVMVVGMATIPVIVLVMLMRRRWDIL
ncbi:MAG: hypothetical protein CMJ90_14565 [Planctomycetes bacterium]|nr:hypothetical protein [Planctomycetota bacterium]